MSRYYDRNFKGRRANHFGRRLFSWYTSAFNCYGLYVFWSITFPGNWYDKQMFKLGLLLASRETWMSGRYFSDGNYLKVVDGILAYKKACGNTIRFATQNIPHAIIQVLHCTIFQMSWLNHILIVFSINVKYRLL